MGANEIVITGAREHNLKDITLRLPRDRFIVITGLSGSGKSSLAFDTIYAEELARVGGQGLDVAALALGVDGVEGERGFAGPGQAGDGDEAVARQPQGDVLEVVLASAGDD